MKKLSILLVTLPLLLSGCGTMTPGSPRLNEEIAITRITSGKALEMTDTLNWYALEHGVRYDIFLPKGLYILSAENSDYEYFEAPDPVTMTVRKTLEESNSPDMGGGIFVAKPGHLTSYPAGAYLHADGNKVLLVMRFDNFFTSREGTLWRIKDIGSNRVPTSNMPPRTNYSGFSVSPPRGSDWYSLQTEQSPTYALFRKDRPSETHSIVASARLTNMPRKPKSAEDFAELIRYYSNITADPNRLQILEYSQTLETRQGQPCVIYTCKSLVKHAPNSPDKPLILIDHGLVYLHPAFRQKALMISYSERGLEEEIDPSLTKEADNFLNGVVIENESAKK